MNQTKKTSPTNSPLIKIIDQIRQQKGDQEAAKLIEAISAHNATALYSTIMLFLTDDDLKEIDQASNEETAFKLIRQRFHQRTGITVDQFLDQLNEFISYQAS